MRRLDERGETLVEVVMALGILSLVLVSSYALATGTFRLGRGAGERTQAVNYLQEQAEALRTYRNSVKWDPVFSQKMVDYSGSTFCMSLDPIAKSWRPVASSDASCIKEGNIALTIKATSSGSDIPPSQYNYVLEARWKTARDNNSVRLTTKLTRQGQ